MRIDRSFFPPWNIESLIGRGRGRSDCSANDKSLALHSRREFTLHGQTVSDLIGAVAILHEASVISAVLPVKIDDLQGTLRMQGHPGEWLDYLTPLLPDNRGFGFAYTLARQRHILLPRYHQHSAERVYGGTDCNKVSSEPLHQPSRPPQRRGRITIARSSYGNIHSFLILLSLGLARYIKDVTFNKAEWNLQQNHIRVISIFVRLMSYRWPLLVRI